MIVEEKDYCMSKSIELDGNKIVPSQTVLNWLNSNIEKVEWDQLLLHLAYEYGEFIDMEHDKCDQCGDYNHYNKIELKEQI